MSFPSDPSSDRPRSFSSASAMGSFSASQSAPRPKKRFGHSLSCLEFGGFENAAYIFGGCLASGKASQDLYKLDLDSMKWEEIAIAEGDAPQPRFSHASVIVGRKLFVFGGCDDHNACFGDLHAFDLDDRSWEVLSAGGQRPSPRHGHTMGVIGSKIYLFGGMHQQTIFGDLYCFDIDTVEWEKLEMEGIVPCPRALHSSITYNQRIYMFGGRSGMNESCNDIWVFKAEKGKPEEWEYIQATGITPSPRFSHGMTVYGDKLVVYGGFTTDSQILQDLLCFDTVSKTWQNSAVKLHLPQCYSHTCVVYNDNLLVYGGRDRYGPLRMDLLTVKLASETPKPNPPVSNFPELRFSGLGTTQEPTSSWSKGSAVIPRIPPGAELSISRSTRRVIGWRNNSVFTFLGGLALGYLIGLRKGNTVLIPSKDDVAEGSISAFFFVVELIFRFRNGIGAFLYQLSKAQGNG